MTEKYDSQNFNYIDHTKIAGNGLMEMANVMDKMIKDMKNSINEKLSKGKNLAQLSFDKISSSKLVEYELLDLRSNFDGSTDSSLNVENLVLPEVRQEPKTNCSEKLNEISIPSLPTVSSVEEAVNVSNFDMLEDGDINIIIEEQKKYVEKLNGTDNIKNNTSVLNKKCNTSVVQEKCNTSALPEKNNEDESSLKEKSKNKPNVSFVLNEVGTSTDKTLGHKMEAIKENINKSKNIDLTPKRVQQTAKNPNKNKQSNLTKLANNGAQVIFVKGNQNNKNQKNLNKSTPKNGTKPANTRPITSSKNQRPVSVKQKSQLSIKSKIMSPSKQTLGRTVLKTPTGRQGFRMAGGRSDPYQDFINLIEKAKLDRKIFTVCGNFPVIRRSFIERGWIEKHRLSLADSIGWRQLENLPNNELFESMKDKSNGERYRKALINKILSRHQVDFFWDYGTNAFAVNSDKIKHTLINRYPAGSNRVYSSKAGLCAALSESHWHHIDGISNIRHPRTYDLAIDEGIKTFIKDFRLTACVSLLKWITEAAKEPVLQLLSTTGKIPVAVFNFSIIQLHTYLKEKQHKDIDEQMLLPKDNDWNVFLDKYYKLVHDINHFKFSNKITKEQIIEQSKSMLRKIEKYWPNHIMDGYMNLWLLKPHNGSQGYGILVCRTLKYILDTVKNVKDRKYIVQKYIERPLLIYKTKFDIRQFVIISHQPCLQLWMYKDCYLRFSSQNYSLTKLHESIHLTNNSIQCRYKNCEDRHSALPAHNMWHCDTFKRYLHELGHPNAWNKIYKGMKECIIGLVMCCQEKMIPRINSFELCGVDFMLTENFLPYLIEINTRPALYNSTPITGRMCPMVLEDMVKVIVDRGRNPNASTGKFELIYKDSRLPSINISASLEVRGINYFTKYKSKKNVIPLPEVRTGVIKNVLNINPDQVKNDVKDTLEKILSIIHVEKEKRITDKEEKESQSETFKNLLSEFVSIISSSGSSIENEKNC